MKFLLYGANGYTAQLILKMYQDFGVTPVIAGRSEAKVKALAAQYNLEYKVFGLDNVAEIEQNIKEFKVVLNCAGPFSSTAKPMVEACLAQKVHYLDITGEIVVFELCAKLSDRAQKAGIMLMPGVGFDVIPTDCAAAMAKAKMPDATHLKIAFAGLGGGISHGTSVTMAQGLGEAGARRENGKIIRVPVGQHGFMVPFAKKEIFCMSIPWGDVSTAFHSTGIPNIETFTQANPKTFKRLKYQKFFNWFLRLKMVRNYNIKQIDKRPAGPSDERREKSEMNVWVEAKNAKNETAIVKLIVKEGYTFTALSALTCVQKVLNNNFKIGFQTPSNAYSAQLVMEIEGSQVY
jgi:short subunit dehydrogenase-like uncharacterized protein